MVRSRWLVALVAPLAGCALPLLGGGEPSTRTVAGDAEWVASVVAAVFREAGIPVARIDRNTVSSGSFHVEDPWISAPLDTRVRCGDDDDVPVRGALVVLEVEAYLSERSAGRRPEPTTRRPPDRLPPSPTPVGRSDGLQTRVALSSRGMLVTGDDAACRLLDSFERQLLEMVAARTGSREAVAGIAPGQP